MNSAPNLLLRTLQLSKNSIDLLVSLPQNQINRELVKQSIRSITSIGANYREACEGESAKDFVHKIRIAKKECRESIYWMELLIKANPESETRIMNLYKELDELVRIFSTISSKFKTKKT